MATREALDNAGFPETPIVVGATEGSVRGTVELCRLAAAAGGDYVLLLPPSYFRGLMDDEAVYGYFVAVADASPLPVVLYNYPGAVAGIDMDSDLLVRLAAHPNIVGTKFTCGMDDPTVDWSEARYKECTTKLGQFLKGTGYNLKTDVFFMPIAAQQIQGIKERVPKDKCPWYDGPSLLEYLDNMQALDRKLNAPFMMPVAGKYRDMGTMIEGKIEAGVVKKGMSLIMMPNKQNVEIAAAYGETEDEATILQCGEQARLRLRGIEEEDILPGFVLCSPKRLCHNVAAFEAQIRILDLKSILTAGFNCVLHVHAAVEEVTFAALKHKLQKGTGRKSKVPPSHAKRGDDIIAVLQVTGGAGSICVETFADYPQMGRFTLRDQGQTIAIGKIIKLLTDSETA